MAHVYHQKDGGHHQQDSDNEGYGGGGGGHGSGQESTRFGPITETILTTLSQDNLFLICLLFVELLGVILVILATCWMLQIGGLGFADKIIFNFHPILMTLGMIFLNANGKCGGADDAEKEKTLNLLEKSPKIKTFFKNQTKPRHPHLPLDANLRLPGAEAPPLCHPDDDDQHQLAGLPRRLPLALLPLHTALLLPSLLARPGRPHRRHHQSGHLLPHLPLPEGESHLPASLAALSRLRRHCQYCPLRGHLRRRHHREGHLQSVSPPPTLFEYNQI